MTWEAVGAIGEVVGAFAVVLSLLYLALQIRHSSKMAEDAAFRDGFAAVTAQLAAMAEGPNAEIILKGLEDFGTLPRHEKYVFDTHMTSLVTLVESTFISNQAEFISDETMANWSFYLRRYISYPGWQDWWSQNKGTFVREAQKWFDSQIENTDSGYDYWSIQATPQAREDDAVSG